ncbi:MAG: hypothetical protein IAX21_11400 [Candidatus Bathyarchaeota archaeon]|nr:MAG: NosD domain-containing protein [Candidatus Bathyarchaeum tardum]WNZ29213.1 MAG: hypothetical protein IAX21_11400 [Candidatus Bathyarchaeota archaeon]
MKKIKLLLITSLLLVNFCAVNLLPVKGAQMIFIRAEGTIEGTNKIYRSGDTYIFSGDIEDSYGIIVEKNNIIIDGKGHTLKSVPRILPVGSWDFGIELSNVTNGNVTIKNLNIIDFNIGVYIWTTGNTITKNTVKGSNVGIFLAACPNTIIENYVEGNIQGVFLGPIPVEHEIVYNVFYLNSFVNNTWNVYDCECTEPKWKQHLNIWNNGTCGNYWGDYNGPDTDGNGIGDIPYQVTEDDVDIFPLMVAYAGPTTKKGFLGTTIPMELGLIITIIATVALTTIVYILIKRLKS